MPHLTYCSNPGRDSSSLQWLKSLRIKTGAPGVRCSWLWTQSAIRAAARAALPLGGKDNIAKLPQEIKESERNAQQFNIRAAHSLSHRIVPAPAVTHKHADTYPSTLPWSFIPVCTDKGETLQLDQGVGDVFLEPSLSKYQQARLALLKAYPHVGTELLHFAPKRVDVAQDHAGQQRSTASPSETHLSTLVLMNTLCYISPP